ncbi:MAG TPA: hypothetical protein VG815_18645, partial [Chloroflexota bacterium]|nr:hypothetical protein [Chloroflexota bacterium]
MRSTASKRSPRSVRVHSCIFTVFVLLGSVFVVGGRPVRASHAPTLFGVRSALPELATSGAIPEPVTSHPRLWITQAELPALRSWAVASNPTYEKGILPMLQQALAVYNTKFAPFYGPNPPATAYPDPGDTQGYTGYLSEEYGLLLAFNSLIDPDAVSRATYAQDARNLLMYAMNHAALGHLSGAPFRDPMFAVYNRANGSGEDWPLIVDWIYPTLTGQDKATIRKVFMMWANDCLNAETTGGDHPSPIGAENSHALLPGGEAYRMAANNYYLGHARLLTMMALSMDVADDPPLNPAQPASVLGNSLRSYIGDATGAWLYQEFAMFGDPKAVAKAYGLKSSAGFGLSSGGLPAEGMLYGHSLGFLLGQLLALKTAGFGTSGLSGPQAALITAPVWRRIVSGFISSLVPGAQVIPGFAYYGPVYQMTSYGDLLRLWMTPDFMQPFALLTRLEQANGQVDAHGTAVDDNAARWYVTNALQGGAAALYTRMTDPYSFIEPVLYFLMLNPNDAAPADPRPAMPRVFVDKPAGRVIARTGWGSNATVFDYRGSWESINHQDADGGQFELYRKGEWLTKEMSNYDSNGLGQTSEYHNTMSLQNIAPDGTPNNLQWFQGPAWTTGSQWNLGQSAGDPLTSISSGSGYVSATSDLTNLYNRPSVWTPNNAALAIKAASRTIVWLNGDFVVIYDRATSKSGLFKRENFELVNPPAISGDTVTEVTPDGQRLFLQSLLPAK